MDNRQPGELIPDKSNRSNPPSLFTKPSFNLSGALFKDLVQLTFFILSLYAFDFILIGVAYIQYATNNSLLKDW